MSFWQKEVIGMTYRQIGANSILAIVLIVAGIIAGRVVNSILKRALDRARIEKTNAYNFFKFLIVVIKWSVYILFLNLAIKVLSIPQFTSWITDVLIVIPAIIGGLMIIVIGFAIAVYLRKIVEESKVESSEILSNIIFYFIIYVSIVFALKTALISLDTTTVNIIVIVLTGVVAAGAAFKTLSFRTSRRLRVRHMKRGQAP